MKLKSTLILFAIIIFGSQFSFAQNNLNIDNFRSSENPYYWKNKKPVEGYWQQDVYYTIKASINEKTDILTGEENLTYWNNSPDELNFVYFHLYQNAFQPNSYLDNLKEAYGNMDGISYGKYEKEKKCLVVESISSENTNLKTELDNSILKVYLAKPLKSGESTVFSIKFQSFFDIGAEWRRMSVFDISGNKHYNGGHWYPRISVYDRKFGWTADQHLGHEFYGDFGVYDVELNFANNFVVDATGILLNESEVLPEELRSKLDIKNFKDKPLGEKPSIITPYDSTIRKTWKFHAENVHDFAFLADPTFRIGETTWNGIKCVALAQESNASKWQNASEYTAKVIKNYSEQIGNYCYPKMIVSDARSGMEYPMLTMDSELDPDYKFVLAHEVGHNWFFGQVGNNETYRAALDEGFTQFITVWFLDKISKDEPIQTPETSNYLKKFQKNYTVAEKYLYNVYMQNVRDNNDVAMNNHSDNFPSNSFYSSTYQSVYDKPAIMLYNLQYVLGDDLFWAAMKNYFNQWKFSHPYFEDFRSSIIHFTKVDLNWFFDEWLETTKTIDYKVCSAKSAKEENKYIVTFERKGDMQMPIDFSVTCMNDSVYNFHIPNTYFVKNTTAKVLPRWTGWGQLNKTYKAEITLPDRISNINIDPTRRLADVNMLNNSLGLPVTIGLDAKVWNTSDWKKYELFARPELWWNGYDGIKAGFNLNGAFMRNKNAFDATVWINTGMFQYNLKPDVKVNEFEDISYRISYSNNLNKISNNTTLYLAAKNLDGLNEYVASLNKYDKKYKNGVYIRLKSIYRTDSTDLNYLLYPGEWGISANPKQVRYNNTITLGATHSFGNWWGDKGSLNLYLKSSALNSNYDFSQIVVTLINKNNILQSPFLKLNTRIHAVYGFGTNIAPESSLFMAGANPEEMMNNKYTRANGFVDNTWLGYGAGTNHFQAGGGLNLRGYAGYLVAEKDKEGNIISIYKGHSGASANAELEFGKYPFLKNYLSLTPYLFGDAGVISINDIKDDLILSSVRADAGIGAALTIQRFGPLQMVNPLTIRFDVPFFLNRTPAVEPDFVKFRWVVGINRAF
ncbi:MAG: M1 family peptidase [Bacteroidetes bacterium]|nr:M1 family peptidase [Bacteroidota bacterium]